MLGKGRNLPASRNANFLWHLHYRIYGTISKARYTLMMRIEVVVGSEGPQAHALKNSKIIIGSSESANIVIPSSAGISRKHLELEIENEKAYVTDLGSTNGTFINEERLLPKIRTEFTSFFPVRLGQNVFLSLLADEEPKSEREPQTSTSRQDKTDTQNTAVSEFKKTKVGKRQKSTKVPVKGRGKVPDSTRMRNTVLMIGAMLALIAYYNITQDAPLPEPAKPTEPSPEVSRPTPVPQPQVPSKITDSEIPSMEEFQNALGEVKCTTTLEKKLCDIIPESTQSYSGVVESVGRIFILMPEEKWHKASQEATASLDEKTGIITLLFLRSLPEFPWKETEKNVYFVFYRTLNSRSEVSAVVGIRAAEIAPLLSTIPKDPANDKWIRGSREISKLQKHYSIILPTTVWVEEPTIEVTSPTPQGQTPGQPAATSEPREDRTALEDEKENEERERALAKERKEDLELKQQELAEERNREMTRARDAAKQKSEDKIREADREKEKRERENAKTRN